MKKIILSTIALAALAIPTTFAADNDNDPLSFQRGNTYIKFGGFINLTTGYYLEGATSTGKDFIPSQAPIEPSADEEGRLQFDPSSTRLSFKMVQTTEKLGDVSVYVESDFRGSSNTLVLRVATVDFKGFTIGQTWSNMTDNRAESPTIDLTGVNSRTFFRTPQIAYRYDFSKCLSAGGAIESPVYNTADDVTPEIRVPDIILFAKTKGSLGHLKIAGVWREIPYCVGEDVNMESGWGVQLSGTLNATKCITLYSQGIYGKNISKYINDFAALSYDLLETDDASVRLSAPMYGASIGAKVDVSDKLAISSSFSKAFIDIDDSYAGDLSSTYNSGTYLSATAIYTPFKNVMTGLEYLRGVRNNYDGAMGRSQRLNLLLRYIF